MDIAPVSELSQLCHLAPDSEPEWDGITSAHQNVLLEGPRNTTEGALVLLVPFLSEPIVWRRPGEALELGAGPFRTLIVEDVGALHAEEQTRLRGWLDSVRRQVQLLSTNRKALFPLVTRGRFDEPLYYRLNVMLLQCGASADRSGSLTAADGQRRRKTRH